MSIGVRGSTARDANRLIDRAARIGFIAKGLVAMVIGAVALRLAAGDGAQLIGPEGALRTFVGEPMGRVLLGFMAAGLWAHAAWKLVQTLLDPEGKGSGIPALAERAAFGGAALGYAALGLVAARLALGHALGPSGDADDLAARVLTPGIGRGLVGTAGVVGIVMGVLQIRLGAWAGFRDIFDLERMHRAERVIIVSLGRAGYIALGVITGIIGWSLLRVALLFDPEEAGGWSDALRFLARMTETRWPLGVVAAGLVSYGLYFALQARYRRIDPATGATGAGGGGRGRAGAGGSGAETGR